MSAVGSEPRTSSSRSVLVPVLALVAVVLLAFAAFSGDGSAGSGSADAGEGREAADGGPADASDAATEPERSAADAATEQEQLLALLERREPGDPRAVGDVDAPVSMILWSDFQCPFCASFARDTMPVIVERFVDDGVLRIEWRDLPVLGEESVIAALAGRAAADQGAFWALHDEIFAEDRPRNAGALDHDAVLALAGELGLDVDRLARDMDDPSHLEAVQHDRAIAQQLGITGTPGFLIGGRPLIGGHPASVFVEAIDRAAAEAGA